jgi:hypothetical protein
MAAPFWAMVGVDVVAKIGLYVGLVLSLIATGIYLRDGWGQLRSRQSSDVSRQLRGSGPGSDD